MIDHKDLNAVLDLCSKATPGPWEVGFLEVTGHNRFTICDLSNCEGHTLVGDMDFIALARTALPYYVKRCAEFTEMVDKLNMSAELHLDDFNRLEIENATLQAEVSKLRTQLVESVTANNNQLNPFVDDLLVHELHYQNGEIDMKIGGESAMLFMTAIIEFFKQNGGQDYLTISVGGQGEEYSITIQNLQGELSPAVRIGQLEKVADIAKNLVNTEPGSTERGIAVADLRDTLVSAGYGE